MCLIVFLVSRGVVYLISRRSEHRGRRPPPEAHDDDEWVLAA
jgi:hypothetical protein